MENIKKTAIDVLKLTGEVLKVGLAACVFCSGVVNIVKEHF